MEHLTQLNMLMKLCEEEDERIRARQVSLRSHNTISDLPSASSTSDHSNIERPYSPFSASSESTIHASSVEELTLEVDSRRKHLCTVEGCNAGFSTRSHLLRHMRSHENVREFACDWVGCGRSFSRKDNLRVGALFDSATYSAA